MNHEQWKLWKRLRNPPSESWFVRYGVAILLPFVPVVLIFLRPSFGEVPFFLFLGTVALSAVNGGITPALVTTGLSALLLRFLFIHPVLRLEYGFDYVGVERMIGFILVSFVVSSFVSASRRDRLNLRDSEARYRMLADTASDAIIVIDDHGEILYVNPVAERIFGGRTKELLGRNLGQLLPGGSYQSQLDEMKRQVDSRKQAVAVQFPALRQSGEHLLVEMTLGNSTHRGKNLFTAIIRDITGQAR